MAGEFLNELAGTVASLLEDLGEFTDLCTVEFSTLADDGRGGKEQVWASLNTGGPLPCVAYPGTGRKELLGEVPTGMAAYTVLARGGVAVTSKDRVRVLARGSEPERLVKVVCPLPQLGVVTEIVGAVKL